MNRDKQKLVILAVLVMALLGVGAYQFIGGTGDDKKSSKPQQDVTTKKPGPKAAEEAVVADLSMIGLTRKDPFQPWALPGSEPQNPEPPREQQQPSPSVRSPSSSSKPLPPFNFDALPVTTPGNVEITPSTPLRSPDEFSYSLVGVVDGPKPVAVFRSDTGEQRMVRINEPLGSDSKVVNISNGRVTIQHRGKNITLAVGGN